MARIDTFEDAKIWQRSRLLTQQVYELYTTGPFSRDFALRDQINRSTGSMMDNIAEGFGRDGNRELIQFLSFTKGSSCEVISQLVRAFDRKYISSLQFQQTTDEVRGIIRMTSGLMEYRKTSEMKGTKFKR